MQHTLTLLDARCGHSTRYDWNGLRVLADQPIRFETGEATLGEIAFADDEKLPGRPTLRITHRLANGSVELWLQLVFGPAEGRHLTPYRFVDYAGKRDEYFASPSQRSATELAPEDLGQWLLLKRYSELLDQLIQSALVH